MAEAKKLGDDHLIDAKKLIERGIRADKSAPSGHAYLVRTQDNQRSTRWRMFKKIADIWPERNGIEIHYVDDRKHGCGDHNDCGDDDDADGYVFDYGYHEDDNYAYEDENRSRGSRTSRGRVGHAGHTRLAY